MSVRRLDQTRGIPEEGTDAPTQRQGKVSDGYAEVFREDDSSTRRGDRMNAIRMGDRIGAGRRCSISYPYPMKNNLVTSLNGVHETKRKRGNVAGRTCR
jgi:hypothetical protein